MHNSSKAIVLAFAVALGSLAGCGASSSLGATEPAYVTPPRSPAAAQAQLPGDSDTGALTAGVHAASGAGVAAPVVRGVPGAR